MIYAFTSNVKTKGHWTFKYNTAEVSIPNIIQPICFSLLLRFLHLSYFSLPWDLIVEQCTHRAREVKYAAICFLMDMYSVFLLRVHWGDRKALRVSQNTKKGVSINKVLTVRLVNCCVMAFTYSKGYSGYAHAPAKKYVCVLKLSWPKDWTQGQTWLFLIYWLTKTLILTYSSY